MSGRIVIAFAFCSLLAAPARADELTLSYFLDGHAAVVYGSLAGAAAVWLFVEPPKEPRGFDPGEGGAPYKGNTVPSWTLGLFAGATGLTVLATPTDGRSYHVKGLGEGLATTFLATSFAKRYFARHRPDYVAGDPITGVEDGRRSFFSGHSSTTLACTTYLGLYFRYHLAPKWKSPDTFMTWWEAATYTGLAGISLLVPASRVTDNRHHPTDVMVGSLVGASLSAGFFFWQEHRYERSRENIGTNAEAAGARPLGARSGPKLTLVPLGAPAGVALVGRF